MLAYWIRNAPLGALVEEDKLFTGICRDNDDGTVTMLWSTVSDWRYGDVIVPLWLLRRTRKYAQAKRILGMITPLFEDGREAITADGFIETVRRLFD